MITAVISRYGDRKREPQGCVIDKRGNIVSRIQGAPDFAKLHKLLEEKLGEAV